MRGHLYAFNVVRVINGQKGFTRSPSQITKSCYGREYVKKPFSMKIVGQSLFGDYPGQEPNLDYKKKTRFDNNGVQRWCRTTHKRTYRENMSRRRLDPRERRRRLHFLSDGAR